ncbi:histidine kinase N-terminal 7TM domain-containing protein [Halobaculum marinum]|uniref:histidine kinase n=1 Tax=Halobaculum marinum TaxID=3031996 RepID=A0ABD5WT65_9EURY|nr:histidine kinase N-terminal 7TM domain-containing protein [Halobaculum sp. DT55]
MSATTYVVPLLWVAGATSLAVLLLVLWRRRVSIGGPEVLGFVGLAVGATLWTWSYALQLSATTLPVIVAYNHLLWIGTGIVGASWPVFAFAVAGEDRWLTRYRLPLISGVPLGFALLAISNRAHNLIYSDVSLVAGEVVRSTVTPGIGFGVFLLWSFGVNSYVLWRVGVSCRGTTGAARARRLVVFAAGLLPMIAGIASIAGASGDSPVIDFTPVTFSVTTLFTGAAITRYRLLDSIAVAQDHVVNRLSDPVVVVDGDETVRATNAAATRLFGGDDPVGRSLADVFRSHPRLVEAIREASSDERADVTVTFDEPPAREPPATSGTSTTADDRVADPADATDTDDRVGAGGPRTFTVSVSALAGTDAVALVFRDITDRRLAEQRAAVLNRMLRHDLRNDISVIDGYLDLLRQELGDADTDAVADALDVLTARADGMIDVTEQAALADSVVDADTDVRRFDATAVVRRRCEQATREHPGVRLDTSLPDGAVHISAVAAFPSVVDNLIENAIEHADGDQPHLVVSLTVAADGSTVELRVADDGPGLPPDDRAILVGDDPSLERASGLGLWLVNRIVRLSGGSVTATDGHDGGTTVSVTLPVAGPPTAPSTAADADAPDESRTSV